MLGVGRHGVGEQRVHGVVEADHVEAVGGTQAAERVDQALLRLRHRGAAHRAGIVDHEDHLARQRLLSARSTDGGRDERQQVVGIADALAEQPDRRRFLGGRLPGELEVAIGRHRAVGERHDARCGIDRVELDGVMMALHLAEREAGREAHRDPGRVDRRMQRGVEHRRRDAVAVWHRRHRIGAIRHRIGDARAPAVLARTQVDALHHRRRIEARTDHERHAQREFAARLAHRLLVFDLHQHGLARADIGDRIGEDVRPLLLGQRGLAALLARLLVGDARGLALLDVADHDAVADHHLERVDRAALGQRVDIDRLDPVVGGVAEDLRDAAADGRPRHRQVDVDAEPRRLGVAGLALEQQRAGARVARPRQHRPGGLQARQKCRNCQQNRGSALRHGESDRPERTRMDTGLDFFTHGHVACSLEDCVRCARERVSTRA